MSLVVASLSLSPEKALASQAIASVSSTAAIYPANPLCKVREDSFSVAAGPLCSSTSLATEEALAMTYWNPSLAKGMIRRGFLDPRIASPSLPLAIVSPASSVQAEKNPAPMKGLICQGFLGLRSASPST